MSSSKKRTGSTTERAWARYEQRTFSDVRGRDEKRLLAGLTNYVAKHNFSIKAGYCRLNPQGEDGANQSTLPLQLYHFGPTRRRTP